MTLDYFLFGDTFILLVVGIIVAVLVFIFALLSATVLRRFLQAHRYRKLDAYRASFARDLAAAIDSGTAFDRLREFAFVTGSLKWRAMEDVLFELAGRPEYRGPVKELFVRLAYVDRSERALRKRNVISKATAIDKLGRMAATKSAEKLLPLLAEENGEVVTVTVRALSRIGSPAGLDGILKRMPDLLAKGLISRKTLETSLRNFGAGSAGVLIDCAEREGDPVSRAALLEVLAGLSASEARPLASRLLDHLNPEIRSKALKIIGAAEDPLPGAEENRATSLLDDPVWFVRLQAAKALGSIGCVRAIDRIGDRLMDANWQVRNAAATALARFGDAAIPIFLGILEHTDRYAKESVCEEMEKTGFVDALIANLVAPRDNVRENSRRILAIMWSLGYRAPLDEFARTGTNEVIRREIEAMIREASAA